jgi:hypothetical protein
MVARKSWLDWWLKFLDVAPHGVEKALEVLVRRYVEEKQHIARFTQHAQHMQYSQFRHKLLAIAAAETEHADCLAEKIISLGGRLPDVPAVIRQRGRVGSICSKISRKNSSAQASCSRKPASYAKKCPLCQNSWSTSITMNPLIAASFAACS